MIGGVNLKCTLSLVCFVGCKIDMRIDCLLPLDALKKLDEIPTCCDILSVDCTTLVLFASLSISYKIVLFVLFLILYAVRSYCS
jgi:hypothetical protein